MSAKVVVDVLLSKEGRVERVWQKGELNAFALWLGEQLMTQVRFRPARVRRQTSSYHLAHGIQLGARNFCSAKGGGQGYTVRS